MKIQLIHKVILSAVLCAASPSILLAQNGPARGPARIPGPPAPVPPAVAMSRPTQAEVDKINADLQQFIEKSSDKELLTKYQSLLKVQVPRDNPCIRPVQTNVRSPQRHERFVEIANTNSFDMLFEGDSITDWWQQNGTQGGAEVQKK